MKETSIQLYEFILRQCGAADPNPWYPSVQAPADGVSRADLDQALDDLRLGGLIRLTEWVQGQGQGYALTPAGSQIAHSPAALTKLGSIKPVPAALEDRFAPSGSSEGGPTTL